MSKEPGNFTDKLLLRSNKNICSYLKRDKIKLKIQKYQASREESNQ